MCLRRSSPAAFARFVRRCIAQGIIGLLLSVTLAAGGARAAPVEARPGDQVAESQAVAFHLVVFLKYVRWPEPPKGDEPWRVGLLGRSDIPDFNSTVTRMLSAKPAMDGRTIEVLTANSVEKLLDCHVVLINTRAPSEVATILQGLGGRPVLTVIYRGRDRSGPVTGAAIELVFIPQETGDSTKGKVVFHLNKDVFEGPKGLRPTQGLLDAAAKRPSAHLPGELPLPAAPPAAVMAPSAHNLVP